MARDNLDPPLQWSVIHFDSKYRIKYKFAPTFIQLVPNTNLFQFEVVQRCQYCQLCALRENSHEWPKLNSNSFSISSVVPKANAIVGRTFAINTNLTTMGDLFGIIFTDFAFILYAYCARMNFSYSGNSAAPKEKVSGSDRGFPRGGVSPKENVTDILLGQNFYENGMKLTKLSPD